jgi:hypothetical protein
VAKHLDVLVLEVCERAEAALERDMSSFVCNGVTIKRQQIVQECETGGDICTELNVEYLLTLTPFQHVCAHLQATALRLFPDRCLRVPTRSPHQSQYIRMWSSRDLQHHKFDLAQVWSVCSPSTFTTAYSYRRALLGEPHEKPAAELHKESYPSMTFFRIERNNTATTNGRMVVAMAAADIISFLQSEFARRGPFNEIFEADTRPGGAAPTRTPAAPARTPAAPARTPAAPVAQQPPAPPPPYAAAVTYAPPSPRRVFAAACADRMRELEHSLRASAELQRCDDAPQERAAKRRKLAAAAAGGMTRVLFDAHKLVLDEVLDC